MNSPFIDINAPTIKVSEKMVIHLDPLIANRPTHVRYLYESDTKPDKAVWYITETTPLEKSSYNLGEMFALAERDIYVHMLTQYYAERSKDIVPVLKAMPVLIWVKTICRIDPTVGNSRRRYDKWPQIMKANLAELYKSRWYEQEEEILKAKRVTAISEFNKLIERGLKSARLT